MTENAQTTVTAIAVAGSVDSGKSSFIGVITSGKLDDGNGSARTLVANHQHEIQSGKTSDISTRYINIPETNSSVTLIDLCGHDKYFHTTTYGLAGHFPDYAFLVISANRGVLSMTKQHFRVLLCLNVPICVIVTHIDITPKDVYHETLEGLRKTIVYFYGKKSKVTFANNGLDQTKSESELTDIKNVTIENTVSILAKHNGKQNIFPVITISNKTGYFIDVVHQIIKRLTPRQLWVDNNTISEHAIIRYFTDILGVLGKNSLLQPYKNIDGSIFYIDNCYNPPGIGLVITGISRGNDINVGDTLYLTPINKDVIEFRIKSIHNNVKQLIPALKNHYRGTIAMGLNKKNDIKRSQIRKGMLVLSSIVMAKQICYHFKAIITFFAQSVTVKNGYEAMIHMGNTRQTARIIIDPSDNEGNEILGFEKKKSNVAIVTFKFVRYPEYIDSYSIFLIRNGGIHGTGMVLYSVPLDQDTDAQPDRTRKSSI